MHERALDETIPLVDAVRPDQLDLPTPCTEWNVRALLNHMVGGNRMFAAVAEGVPLQQARPAGDVLGDDPAESYRRSAEALKAAWHEPGRIEGTYELPFGKLPGKVALVLRLTETVTHGWDLAKATGQTPQYDDDLVQAAAQFSEQNLSRERPPGGPIGPAVDCADDAPAIDRFAAFMGRRP
jgi:uncharacterized protein (TIGR03086 family)